MRKNEDKSVNTYGRRLVDITKASGMIFLNGRKGSDREKGSFTFYNHIGKATNDYMICNKSALRHVKDFKVHDINIWSDHCAISCIIECRIVSLESEERDKSGFHVSCRWKEEKRVEFLTNINTDIVNTEILELQTIIENAPETAILDSAIMKITSIITNAGSGHIKVIHNSHNQSTKTKHKQLNKWYDKDCSDQRKLFIESLNKYYFTYDPDDRINMSKERSRYRKLCRSKKTDFNRSEATRMLHLSKKEPKQFWREVKGDKSKSTLPKLDFFNHFKRLAEQESNLDEHGLAEVDRELDEDYFKNINSLDEPFSLGELNKAIQNLKLNKAAGVDYVVNEFIVNSSPSIKLLLLTIFNVLMQLEYFPEFWTNGLITPIFKKGDNHNLNNYRGITVLSCLGKLFTKLLNDRLTKWVEYENKLTESQFGFRKGRGTIDSIFVLQGLIDILFSQGKKCYVCFIDYSKAYDLIDRTAMYTKLIKTGISSKYVNLIKSFYSQVKLAIKGDTHDQSFYSNYGLLQGESLSPLLFSLFVNDLPDRLTDESVGVRVQDVIMKLLMFADDMSIFSESREGLQLGIDQLKDYCTKWGITVNIDKTKVVVFRKGGRQARNDTWSYNGNVLEVVQHFKYLGCQLSSSGSFNACMQSLSESGRRGLFSLKQYFHRNPEVTPRLQIQLFNTMILPILMYCSEVWGLHNSDRIETFHLSFLKSILCVKKSTPNCFIYGELGMYPIHIELKLRVIKFWLKIIRSTTLNDNYIRKIYVQLLFITITHPNQVTWVSRIRDLFNMYDMGNYWIAQHIDNENNFLTVFKQRLQDKYKQEWATKVNITTDGRIFKHLKQSFVFEQYLDMPNKHLRVSITKIRLSSHLLFVERGRWANIVRPDRKCECCRVIEDEYHVFIECPRFINERKRYLPISLKIRPSMFKFLNFIKCTNENEFITVGKLCASIQREHRKYI